ncbi:MAG: TonB family protein [Desulfovibrio sp.]
MRFYGLLLSLALHGLVLYFALFFVVPKIAPVSLDKPVYEVDLVSLLPQGDGSGAPKVEQKEPVPEVKPEPKPESPKDITPIKEIPEPKKPEPKEVEKPKEIEKPKPIEKPKTVEKPKPVEQKKPEEKPKQKPVKKLEAKPISPKKVNKPVVKKKPKPKPQPSPESLLNDALKDVKKSVSAQKKKEQDAFQRELQQLRKESAKKKSSAAGSGGSVGTGESGLYAVYASIVEKVVKKQWRYPVFGTQQNLLAVVLISINKDGVVTNSVIETSSGSADFDSSVLRAVRETEALPPPPDKRVDQIRITFNLNELNG